MPTQRDEQFLKDRITELTREIKALTVEKKAVGDELLAITRTKAIAQAERLGVTIGDMYEQRGQLYKITGIYMNAKQEVCIKTKYGQYGYEQTFKLSGMKMENIYRKVGAA